MSAEQGGTTGPEKLAGLALVDAGKSTDGVDEAFRRSMASLSRQLAAVRSAESASPTSTGPRNRQVDFDLGEPVSRRPPFKLALAFALGVVISIAGIYAFQAVNSPALAPPPPSTTMMAAPASAPSPMPAISPPSPTLPPPSSAAVDPVPAVQPPAVAAVPAVPATAVPNVPVPAVRTADQADLSAAEVLELQTRLESLGMNPGFLDGIPGPRTAAAVRRYEEARGQPPTGNLDRELLKRLRQERN